MARQHPGKGLMRPTRSCTSGLLSTALRRAVHQTLQEVAKTMDRWRWKNLRMQVGFTPRWWVLIFFVPAYFGKSHPIYQIS